MVSVRMFRLLILALVLLVTQVGGLAHGVGHHGDQDKPHGACQLCAAYADFEHGAKPQVPTPPMLDGELPSPAMPRWARFELIRLVFRSRAPPALA